jgi:hypothetical protein
MDKYFRLRVAASRFRASLEGCGAKDDDAKRLLTWLMPLFEGVERGEVVPPTRYRYRFALGKDSSFYNKRKAVVAAEADFVAALEDWPSQKWYQDLESH